MKKWLLMFSGAILIICVVAVLLWWKNRLPETTLTTSYGLTVTVPSGFSRYDFSVMDFLDDSGETFTRCSTPNTNTTDACSDELTIAMGILDVTALDVNKVQAATGAIVPDGAVSFDLPWLLAQANNDVANKEETALTVSGLPATGLLITRKSTNAVEYYIRIAHPAKQVGIYVSGRGSEAQNVKAVTESLLQSITYSDR